MMNKYYVYYRYTDSQYSDYCLVVADSVQSAIDNALEEIPTYDYLELSEIDICHVEKMEEEELCF